MKRVKRLLVVLLALCMVVVPMTAFGAGSQIDYTESNGNYTYSVNVAAEFLQGKGVAFVPEGQYLLLIVKDTDNDEDMPSFTADDIMYIDQTASDNSGVSFSGVGSTEGFIPREYSPATGEFYNKVFITGTGIASPIYLGYLQGVPGVTVSGSVAASSNTAAWRTGDTTVTLTKEGGASASYSAVLTVAGGNIVDNTTSKKTAETFAFNTVSAAKYTLAVKKPHFAPYEESVTVSTSAVELDAVALYNYGDVSKDGKINSTDAVQTLRNGAKFTGYQKLLADINGDNKANSTDAVNILRYKSGSTFPVDK
ncbi:MAG: hypothetical protein E7224_00625 [Clostridiales bacterium]|nr:hypothetical protein [Clostridiales bacterium]